MMRKKEEEVLYDITIAVFKTTHLNEEHKTHFRTRMKLNM